MKRPSTSPRLISSRLIPPSIIGLALLLSSCATDHKRAEALMEGGRFEEAAAVYEAILKRNPGDAEAAVKLAGARAQHIDYRLIEVRKARLSGNMQQALDLFEDVVEKEAAWKLPPQGKAAFTQGEEREYVDAFAASRVSQDLGSRLPLKASWFLKRYKPALTTAGTRHYEALQSRVLGQGRASCQRLRGEPMKGRPYYALFAADYCKYWGEAGPKLPAEVAKLPATYFQSVALSGGVAGFRREQTNQLRDVLQGALARTAWYDAEGRLELPIVLTGRFSLERDRARELFSHPYVTSEPYVDYQQVQVPYTTTENVFDARTQSYRPQMVTKYKTEERRETRYRDVSHTHQYWGWRHEQRIDLSLTATLAVASSHRIESGIKETSQTQGIEHHENVPAIKLQPSSPALEDPNAWTLAQEKKLATDAEAKLVGAWKDLFCKASGVAGEASAASPSVLGNTVQKCIRQVMAEYPAFAEEWYQRHFGVSVKQARELL